MFVRQVKRKCSVRGCKNTDCFAISRTREVGNTVIICKSCLDEALASLDEIDPKTKSNIPAIDNTAAPPLFFNAKAFGTGATETRADDVPPVTPENGQENTTPLADADGKEPEQLDGVDPADDTTDADGTAPQEDVTVFRCPNCGRAFDSEKGLTTHLRYCKEKSEE